MAIALVGLGYYALSSDKKPITAATFSHSTIKATLTDATVPSFNRALPEEIVIPAIHITTKIDYLGITRTGTMAAPTNIVDVGWYENGALPGNTGTAVIVGHVDGPRGQPAVFANLSKLQAGNQIVVIDAKGQSTTFQVTHLASYSQSHQTNEVFTSTAGAHLNLITCTGAWDASEHRFTQRLVVFSDKV